MKAFELPEVEGLEKQVKKGLPTDLFIEICQGFVRALDGPELTGVYYRSIFPQSSERGCQPPKGGFAFAAAPDTRYCR